jgi:hypothetical protein
MATTLTIHGLANRSGEIIAFVAPATPSAEAVREHVPRSAIEFVASADARRFTLTIGEEHISVLRKDGGKGFVGQYKIEGQDSQVQLVRR